MKIQDRENYWADGDSYNDYIEKELNSFRKNAWKKQITQHFPPNTALTILDVGSGPGFFSIILSEEGHTVTGIDSSTGMLEHAKENAKRLNVTPTFLQMDINHLNFPNDSFDVVLSRNVTWTLEHPDLVYTEFKRILKPGGILLIYDANWQMHYFDAEWMKRVRAREQHHFEKYGWKEVVSNGDVAYYQTAPLTRTMRPAWDKDMLERKLRMEVHIQEDIGRFVYEEWEKELYGESPLFEICAMK